MSFLQRCQATLVTIWYCLFPDHTERTAARSSLSAGAVASTGEAADARAISWVTANFHEALDQNGRLSVCFTGCFAVAAPFLMFRLKRSGFSNCSAWAGEGSVVISALR